MSYFRTLGIPARSAATGLVLVALLGGCGEVPREDGTAGNGRGAASTRAFVDEGDTPSPGRFRLVIEKEGDGKGRVDALRAHNCTDPARTLCAAAYAPGERVVVVAKASDGSTFAGWRDSPCKDNDSSASRCEIDTTEGAMAVVTAVFVKGEKRGRGEPRAEPEGLIVGTWDADRVESFLPRFSGCRDRLTFRPGGAVTWSAVCKEGTFGTSAGTFLIRGSSLRIRFAVEPRPPVVVGTDVRTSVSFQGPDSLELTPLEVCRPALTTFVHMNFQSVTCIGRLHRVQ